MLDNSTLDSSASVVPVLLASLAGLLIGSFLNVCIYRVPRDLSVVFPRSFCPGCESRISAFDNIPLLSYLLLRGRCRHCGQPISFRYPAVEAITSILFGTAAFHFGLNLGTVKWLIFEALLVVLFWTDWEVGILPDEFTLGGTVAAIVLAFFVPVPGIFGDLLFPTIGPIWGSLANAVAGAFLLATPIWTVAIIFAWVLKAMNREAPNGVLGLGDVKLLLMIGSFLGAFAGLQVLVVATVGGSLLGGVYALVTRKRLFTQELRFGCFLCAAASVIPLLPATVQSQPL